MLRQTIKFEATLLVLSLLFAGCGDDTAPLDAATDATTGDDAATEEDGGSSCAATPPTCWQETCCDVSAQGTWSESCAALCPSGYTPVISECANTECPEIDAGIVCPEVRSLLCFDTPCCSEPVEGTLDEENCVLICPEGYDTTNGACDPSDPSCPGAADGGVDGGSTMCPEEPPFCFAGPCCESRLEGTWDASCEAVCPTDFSAACTPDPAAFCAEPWYACDDNEDCVVESNSCCAPCGGDWGAESVDGVNSSALARHQGVVCPIPTPCPACESLPNPDIYATCITAGGPGQCVVRDIAESDVLTSCASASECVVRAATCCECGADTSVGNLIAIRADAEAIWEGQVCNADTACDSCVPSYPPMVRTACTAGRCELVVPGS